MKSFNYTTLNMPMIDKIITICDRVLNHVIEERSKVFVLRMDIRFPEVMAQDGILAFNKQLKALWKQYQAAAKADKPEETVVFYEDPNEFFDGIFVVFGDGSVKYLEGDFDNHVEAMEAAANTFDLSDKVAADLLKKAAEIDKIFED